MKINTSQNKSTLSKSLIDFQISPDFLMNFRTNLNTSPPSPSSRLCPQFSSKEFPPSHPGNLGIPCMRSYSLTARDLRGEVKNVQPETMKVMRSKNPFHNSEDSEKDRADSLRGFLPDLNVSRISADLGKTKFPEFTYGKKEVYRSMDFENVSFEEKSEENIIENNIFFDIRSERPGTQIQKNSQQLQMELQMLLDSKREEARQVPSFGVNLGSTRTVSQSMLFPESRKDHLLNPFKEFPCTSDYGRVNRGIGSLKWPDGNSKEKNMGTNYSMNRALVTKNCFYETDDENDKETFTQASKITISPKESKNKNLISQKLEKMNNSTTHYSSQINTPFGLNESFLTQNKSPLSFPYILKNSNNETIPLYRADQGKALNECRSQSQRSLFSLNIERQHPTCYENKKSVAPFSPSSWQNNSCYFTRKKKPFFPSLISTIPKSSNFLLKDKHIIKQRSKHQTPEKKRPFSPSQHSNKRSKYWPIHMEDRLSNMNSSLCSGVDPFLSCLSPNSKQLNQVETNKKISKIGNRLLEMNKKISNAILNRKNSFDKRDGQELVSLFSEFIHNFGGEQGGYKKEAFLKKVKRC